MYQVDFNKPVKVHFIGIGGISMSGLAEILLDRGFEISGSDNTASSITGGLAEKGIRICIGQKASNITDDIELVVYSAAIHEDNPEFAEVRRRGLPLLTRAELLGQIMKNYANSAAIAGTHGKTTTTSMLSSILLKAGADPTISVGGMLKEIGGNIRIGGPDFFVAEACEYTNSFLNLSPLIAVILNIEEDHLDFFKDLADIRNSFHKFALLAQPQGAVVINAAIDNYKEICEGAKAQVITFSDDPSRDSDYSCRDIEFNEKGCASYTLLEKGSPLERITLSVPGKHNILNSLAAVAAARKLSVEKEAIAEGLLSFTGTDRRFELKGSFNGVTVIDDYAHHPTEIAATLSAAENYPHKTLWCVFQPHTYTRTKSLFDDFVKALSKADRLVMAEIYPARETDTLGMSSKLIAEAVNNMAGAVDKALYFPSFGEIEDFLIKNCSPGDLVITMGAGDVHLIGEEILKSAGSC